VHEQSPAGDADLDELLALALDVAGAAASLLVERRHAVRSLVETKSTVTDMVTEVDRDAEALVVGRLRAARPHDGILGEEGASHEGTSGVRWIVDPLDGTTNYLYGFPAFGVSVAAEIDGETAVGVVADAAHSETYSAVRGRGAFRDGVAIGVSGKTDTATALVGTGFPYAADARAEAARVLTHVLPHVRDVRRAGAAAIDLCWVACGRLDAYYERGLQPWDLAAGDLIVREAGGLTAAFDGGRPRAGSVVAASPALLEPLLALLATAAAGP
jgi:fructose-1,6-bisphosphatase/inositol monophosphatase family enzyme